MNHQKGPSRLIYGLTTITGVIAGILLVQMAIMMSYEVIARYVFNRPTIWATEIAYYTLGVILTWGLAWGLRRGSHIAVDILTERLPPTVLKWISAFNALLTLCVAASLTWTTFLLTLRKIALHEVSQTLLRVPLRWPLTLICIGLLVFTLQAGVMWWERCRSLMGTTDESEEYVKH